MKHLLAALFLILGSTLALADPPTGFPEIPWGAARKDGRTRQSGSLIVRPNKRWLLMPPPVGSQSASNGLAARNLINRRREAAELIELFITHLFARV